MANKSILAAFERMWQHIISALDNKSDIDHTHPELSSNVVRYDEIQKLDAEEKAKAGHNIDAARINDIYENQLVTKHYTWDGTIEGRDSFTLSAGGLTDIETGKPISVTYYKVSDDVLERSLAINCNWAMNSDSEGATVYCEGHRITNGICYGVVCEKDKYYFVQDGKSDYSEDNLAWATIFVEEAGQCVYKNETFNAPSTGVYFPYYSDNSYLCELVFVTSDKTGIFLNSNTKVGDTENNKFIVKVESDGALKTVDKNNTVVKMATESSVASKITSPSSAEVGQILSVKNVDSNGNITWEAIDNVDSVVETDTTLSKEGNAADAKVTGDRLSTVEAQIADLLYKAITITSFTNNGNTTTKVEKGATVADMALTWTTSKTPVALTLDNVSIDASLTSIVAPNLPITSNRTWTLKATDERGHVASKTTKIIFVNGIYYGVIDSGITVTTSVINNLVANAQLTRSLQEARGVTFNVTANVGKHIMFALPSAYGTPMFKDKDTGFEAGFYKANTINFTNSNDHEESYDIWLSTNTGLGSMNITVS